MIETFIVLALVLANNAVVVHVMRRHERTLEDRWQGRIAKCDAVLATAERAEQRTHEALIQMNVNEGRTQDHLLAMERITTDPRVVQALR